MTAPVIVPLAEAVVDEVIARYPNRTGDVLGILEELQKRHPNRFLPKETLQQVAAKTKLSASQIYSVVTFYSFFNLKPQGAHTIMVCRGTACHTRGSKTILDAIKSQLLPEGEMGEEGFTTPDQRITVRTVACIGQCALAPVIVVDEKIYSYVTDQKLKQVMRTIQG